MTAVRWMLLAIALGSSAVARAGSKPAPASAPAKEPWLDTSINASEADEASLPSTRTKWNELDNRFFTFRLGGGYLYDAASYHQDAASKQQLDLVKSNGLRDLRLIGSGRLQFFPRLSYTIAYMFDAQNNLWRFRQTGLMLDLPELGGRFFLGRSKEGFSTNRFMVGYNGWTLERAAANDAFLPTLADGLRWVGHGFGGHLVYNLGGFADVLTPKQPYEKNDYVAAGRAVWLPFSMQSTNLLHLAVEVRYGTALSGSLQYKSKPESFFAPSAVDTGKFPASGSTMVGGEVYFQHAPLLFGAEYFVNRVSSSAANNPIFHGGEAFVSWVPTGEERPYNEEEGFFEAMVPRKAVFDGGPGAVELVLRASYVDLDGGTISGGRFFRLTPEVSWYMSQNVRLAFEYGWSRLDRMNVVGNTQYFQTRLQLTFN
jgi:phosphate-selective porin OprO/OprP